MSPLNRPTATVVPIAGHGAPVSPRVATQRDAATARAGQAIDEEQFAQNVGLMLHSGLTLMDSIKTFGERAAPATARALDLLTLRLRQGETLSGAMQACGAFRPALLACVRASEVTGDLADSLERYAANAARMRALRSRMVSALVYPALLVSVAALVVLFLLVYVVPRFATVLESSSKDLPFMSQLLIGVGRTLNGVPTPVWLALAALLVYGVWSLVAAMRERRLEALLSALAVRIPGIRELVRTFGHAQLARNGAMLARSGVPALKALAMCRDLLCSADRVPLDRALTAAAAGAPLAQALHEQRLIDTLGLRVLRVAEQTGQLDTALDRLADVHDQHLERALERANRLIEPLLMLGIGLVVGGIVVLMYLPIFQLASSIQ
ncbi:MAG: type II secretion system F family protein [Burkholderiaceae bacterium]